MKCKHCNSEWNTPAELGSKLSTCPFCGKELISEKKTAANATSIQEVLAAIVSQHGMELMEKGKRMISFYMDMAPEGLRKEKTLLEHLVRCKGNQLLLEVKDKPLPERQRRYEQVVAKLCSNYISEVAARKVCNAFCIAVYGESVEKTRQEPVKKEETQTPPQSDEKPPKDNGQTPNTTKKPVDQAALDTRTTLYLALSRLLRFEIANRFPRDPIAPSNLRPLVFVGSNDDVSELTYQVPNPKC